MRSAPSPRPTAKLGVHGLTHEFGMHGGKAALTVLRNIDLEIPTGKFVSLIGESGCGKSTLLRLMAGLLRPTRGEVRHDGGAVRGINQALGFVHGRNRRMTAAIPCYFGSLGNVGTARR